MEINAIERREERFIAINAAMIALFLASSTLGGILNFRRGLDYYGYVGVLGPLLLPLLWGALRALKIGVVRQLNFIIYAFFLFAYVLGTVYRGYDNIPGMDKVSHTFAGMFTGMLALAPFYRVKPGGTIEEGDFAMAALCAFGLSMATAPIWEMLEFGMGYVAGIDPQKVIVAPGGPFWLPVADTMGDMFVHMLGSLAFVFSMRLYYKRGVRTPLMGAFEALHAMQQKTR